MNNTRVHVNLESLERALVGFGDISPFNHCIIDNFLALDFAEALERDFPSYNDSCWYVYDNPLENKKALNNWNLFPPNTYKFFSYLVSPEFCGILSKLLNMELFSDPGLHGGGWHIHSNGGNLNPHLDYSIHPKFGLMRKLNLILYISSDLRDEYGGHFGLWSSGDADRGTLELVKEVEPRFNRAILFDTTQDSWHGMSRKLTTPDGITRKSLAIYYLTRPLVDCDPRTKALYAPREDQIGDNDIIELIRTRADARLFSTSYRLGENDVKSDD